MMQPPEAMTPPVSMRLSCSSNGSIYTHSRHTTSPIPSPVWPPPRANSVAHIVGNEQCPLPIDGDADRATQCIAVRAEKAGQYILRLADRVPLGEAHEHDLVSAVRSPVP